MKLIVADLFNIYVHKGGYNVGEVESVSWFNNLIIKMYFLLSNRVLYEIFFCCHPLASISWI